MNPGEVRSIRLEAKTEEIAQAFSLAFAERGVAATHRIDAELRDVVYSFGQQSSMVTPAMASMFETSIRSSLDWFTCAYEACERKWRGGAAPGEDAAAAHASTSYGRPLNTFSPERMMAMPNKHKWSHPLEWLNEKLDASAVQDHDGVADLPGLLDFAKTMAAKLDGDTIQDLFQSDMEDDGYFEETDEWKAAKLREEIAAMPREKVIEFLTGIDIECRDDEPTEVLREALAVNVEDGDIERDAITYWREADGIGKN